MNIEGKSILELTVNNHPGVMSHICGLFARRAYNLEGIMVMPIRGRQDKLSRVWLLLKENRKLDQIIRQTEKLIDVISVKRHMATNSVFEKVEDYFED